jgi:ABC-type antimicrobial peptide transport system permease subunit
MVGTAPLFPLIVIGMLLMSSGLYGVLAFAVSRRTRELAVRMAIGADWGTQVRLVMGQSLRLVMLGSALGIALTFGLSRLVRATGGEGSLYDPPWPAFMLPVFVVLVVAALATWVPMRRRCGSIRRACCEVRSYVEGGLCRGRSLDRPAGGSKDPPLRTSL